MNLPEPFWYPVSVRARYHGPSGYENYQSFKPFLRDEFTFRCIYCLERETWYPNGSDSFCVEHFLPKSKNPSHALNYDNLLYACNRCNSCKGTETEFVPDPTKDPLGNHLRIDEDGKVTGLSQTGLQIIDLLHLNERERTKLRRWLFSLVKLRAEYPQEPKVQEIFTYYFRYPTDLPDLEALRPPAGNCRESGIKQCHFARRQTGNLAQVY